MKQTLCDGCFSPINRWSSTYKGKATTMERTSVVITPVIHFKLALDDEAELCQPCRVQLAETACAGLKEEAA